MFEFEAKANNFLTPDNHANFDFSEETKSEQKSSTVKVTTYFADMHGSLSVISEEKSLQLQESV